MTSLLRELRRCIFVLGFFTLASCSAMEKSVPQEPAKDTVVVIAEDFLGDSAYAVSVDFQACCTDKNACKNMGFGYRLDTMLFVLTPSRPKAKIPLEYARKAACPYRFNVILLGAFPAKDSLGHYSFVKDPQVKVLPRHLDPDCISLPFAKAQKREDCRGNRMYNLPSNLDTIRLRRNEK